MKKLIIVVLVVFIVVTFGACDDNKTIEGDLLYEIGADSLEDVETGEIQCKCDCPGDKIIEDTDDLKFLSNYKYDSDYPQEKLAELLLSPNNFITVTVNGEGWRFRLLEDGSLVGVTYGISCRTYKADAEHCLTQDKFDDLHSEYAK